MTSFNTLIERSSYKKLLCICNELSEETPSNTHNTSEYRAKETEIDHLKDIN